MKLKVLSATCIVLSCLGAASAQTWNNPAGGAWTTNTNWTPTVVPDAVGATAAFGSAASSVTVSLPLGGFPTIGNPAGGPHVTVGSINLSNVSSSSAVAYTLGATTSSGAIQLDNGSSPISINLSGGTNSAGTQRINTVLYVPNTSATVQVVNNGTGPSDTLSFRGFQTSNLAVSSNSFVFSGTGNTLVEAVGGFISATAAATMNGTGTLTFSGLGGAFTLNGGITVNAGNVVFNLTDPSTTPATVGSNGKFYGTGTLNGSVTSGGTISAGVINGVGGALRVGSLQLTGGAMEVEMRGTSVGSGYDQIQAINSLAGFALGNGLATLNVTFQNGFVPAAGDTFTILRHTNNGLTQTGFFANAPVDGQTYQLGGGSFIIDYQSGVNGRDVTLTAVAVPEPATLAMMGCAVIAAIGGWFWRKRQQRQQMNVSLDIPVDS